MSANFNPEVPVLVQAGDRTFFRAKLGDIQQSKTLMRAMEDVPQVLEDLVAQSRIFNAAGEGDLPTVSDDNKVVIYAGEAISPQIVERVLQYLAAYAELGKSAEAEESGDPDTWELPYIEIDLDSEESRDRFYELLYAAEYFEIDPLLDLTVKAIEEIVLSVKVPRLREIFGTPAEEEETEKEKTPVSRARETGRAQTRASSQAQAACARNRSPNRTPSPPRSNNSQVRVPGGSGGRKSTASATTTTTSSRASSRTNTQGARR